MKKGCRSWFKPGDHRISKKGFFLQARGLNV